MNHFELNETKSKCCVCHKPAKISKNFTLNMSDEIYAIKNYCSEKCINQELEDQDMSIVKIKPSQINLNYHEYSREELGRFSWGLLHAVANNYAEKPTIEQMRYMSMFIKGFSHTYPCTVCRRHWLILIKEYPPIITSKKELVCWMCTVHNKINSRLGKAQYKCPCNNNNNNNNI